MSGFNSIGVFASSLGLKLGFYRLEPMNKSVVFVLPEV